MKKYFKFLLAIPVLIGTVFLAGCSDATTPSTVTQEQGHTKENQQRLIKAQPPVSLDWSLERENINKRTSLWNDANKVSYIYLVSYGKVMAFYTIKGKVSSVNSQVTNVEQIVRDPYAYYQNEGGIVMPSPSEDGSYGTNGDAIFFFTTDGAYIEWAGDYMLADQPLKLTTQPELIREIK